jgi:tetratricopeptide (TPR) repeat protein
MVHAIAIGLVVALSAQSSGAPSSQSSDQRTWYRAYDDAKKAIEQKNWTAAIASLEHAKRTQTPGRNRPTYGANFLTFAPDFYLGVAYLNLGQFTEAHNAFERERKASVLQARDKEWRQFETDSARAAFEHELAQSLRQLNAADFRAALASLDRAKAHAVGAELARIEKRRDDIVQAEAAQKSPAANPPRGTGAAATPTLPIGQGGVPELGKSTGLVVPTGPPPANTASTGRNTATTGGTTGAKAGTQKPETPRGTANPSQTFPGTPPITPPPASPRDPEEAGLTKFFSGDYKGAASDFRPLAERDYPLPSHQFYFACSLAAMYLSGQGGRALLEEGMTHFTNAGPKEQFKAALTYISPRIIAVLETGR